MKKYLVCCVRDSAMNAFMLPMCFVAMGQAQRSFAQEVNRKDGQIWQKPEDYELWMVGWFEEDSGVLEPQRPECVARAKDLVVKE